MLNNNEIEDKFYEENKDSNKCLIFIKYNPYLSDIKISINKKNLARNSELNIGKCKFEDWIEKIPTSLFKEYPYDKNFKIGFHGNLLAYDNLNKVIKKSKLNIKEINIELVYYPIQTFDDKLKIIEQIFEEIGSEKESFSEIIDLFDNFKRDLDYNEDLEDKKYSLIKYFSKKLQDKIKFYYEREYEIKDDFIEKEKQKIDNSIKSIKNDIDSLKDHFRKTEEIKNKIDREIEEFQNNFFEEAKNIKDEFLSEFTCNNVKKELGFKLTMFDIIDTPNARNNTSNVDWKGWK